jgi:bla regulator protein blaR1
MNTTLTSWSLVGVLVSGGLALPVRAQQDRPRFEVASIKENVSNDGRIQIQRTGSRYTARGISLALLIRNAYNVQEFQVIGAPPWADSDRFDIVATMPGDADSPPAGPGMPSRQALMVQSLLEERFRLTVHREMREMPVYALVMANADRRLGPSLRRSTVDCAALIAAARGRNPAPAAPPPGELPSCSSSVAPGNIVVRSQTMAEVATALSRLTNTGSALGRLIVDRTGLEGYYDVDLHFTPDRIPNFGPAGPPPGLPPIDTDAASIYAAMREQLGLKLEAQRAPVDVVVIDRVEKPTAN